MYYIIYIICYNLLHYYLLLKEQELKKKKIKYKFYFF